MRISVFRFGYVGAVSCACLAAAGHELVGVDMAPAKVDILRRGRSPIVEALIDDLIAEGVAQGRLTATQNGPEAVAATDLSLICVGTPTGATGAVALDAVDTVIADIGAAIALKAAPHTIAPRASQLGQRAGRPRDSPCVRAGDAHVALPAHKRIDAHVVIVRLDPFSSIHSPAGLSCCA